jgi:hypothetical protein
MLRFVEQSGGVVLVVHFAEHCEIEQGRFENVEDCVEIGGEYHANYETVLLAERVHWNGKGESTVAKEKVAEPPF